MLNTTYSVTAMTVQSALLKTLISRYTVTPYYNHNNIMAL